MVFKVLRTLLIKTSFVLLITGGCSSPKDPKPRPPLKPPVKEASAPKEPVKTTAETVATPKPNVPPPPAEIAAASKPTVSTGIDFCSFPKSLKTAVLKGWKPKDEGRPPLPAKKTCTLVTLEVLRKITHLKLTGLDEKEANQLDKKYAGYFPGLTELDISDNPQMVSLPAFTTYLTDLKKLNISKTGISDFTEDILQLKNLEVLMAAHNNYKNQEPPFLVWSLTSLKILDMSYSKIRYIDEYISKLTNLEELYMQGNQLALTPFMLRWMSGLLVIDFSNNNFVEEPFHILNPYSYYSSLSINEQHTCKNTIENSEERKSCQADMLDQFRCDSWWYPLPFERGRPLRRYKDMSDEEYARFSSKDPMKDRCYTYWLGTQYGPAVINDPTAYSEYTINGKTIREWRLFYHIWATPLDEWKLPFINYTVIVPPVGEYFCDLKRVVGDTVHLPDKPEVIPELYGAPMPEECKKDEHLYK